MEKKIKINIKYTVKDIKAYSFARTISKPLNKILLIISSLIAVFYLVLISLVFFISQGDESIILFTLFLSFFIIFFMNLLVAIIPFVIFYISTLNNYRKSKLMEKLQCLEINYEEMSMHSLSGNFSIKWNDIYRVQELKPCFLIFISPYKSILLPRRCFNNEAQLAEFKSILAEKMQKNKLKLKNYKIGKVSPDDDEKIEAIEPLKEFSQQTAKEEETELLNLCFSLSKKDIIQMNYIR
jgi:signal transduction histidine kinase